MNKSTVKLNLSGHENEELEKRGFTFPGAIHVDLASPTFVEDLVEFLKAQGIGSGTVVHIAFPGLTPLAIWLLVAIHGLTGRFPIWYRLMYDKADRCHRLVDEGLDLSDVRNEIRSSARENVIELSSKATEQ